MHFYIRRSAHHYQRSLTLALTCFSTYTSAQHYTRLGVATAEVVRDEEEGVGGALADALGGGRRDLSGHQGAQRRPRSRGAARDTVRTSFARVQATCTYSNVSKQCY